MGETVLRLPDVFDRIRTFIDLAGGASRFAKKAKLSRSQVSEAVNAKILGPAILDAIGVEKVVTTTYVLRGSNL